jgi:hypothetical protein
MPGANSRYNVNLDLFRDNADENHAYATLGYSGTFGRVNVNQQMQYRTGGDTGSEAHSLTSLRGFVKGVYVRGDVDYRITPDAALDTWALNLQRYVNEKLDLEFNHREEPDDDYAENTIQANIRTGYATVSPSLTRNSSGDITAYVNTSFGLSRDPATKKLLFSDQQAGATGNLSARVFLDKDGDGLFDGDDEPIENATVVAVQNGGQATTDKDGYAHLKQLQHFRQSDLSIIPDSLPDPFWVPAKAGVSFLPRQGHVTQIALPVNIAGQIEGNVFTQEAPPGSGKKKGKKVEAGAHEGVLPAGGVTLSLYNAAGEKIMTTTTEGDGYYIFSPVPPGQYALVIDSTGRPAREYSRPDPLPVKIGYEGTDLTGRNIYLTHGADVPVKMVSDLKTIEKADPALSLKALEDKMVVLNLGQYHSRLLMGVMWFKLQKTASAAVRDLQPLVEPSDSYADAATGEHTLRVGSSALDVKDARARCEAITKAGVSCTVEVLPGGMKLAEK